jgi:signal transduction histidine kinase
MATRPQDASPPTDLGPIPGSTAAHVSNDQETVRVTITVPPVVDVSAEQTAPVHRALRTPAAPQDQDPDPERDGDGAFSYAAEVSASFGEAPGAGVGELTAAVQDPLEGVDSAILTSGPPTSDRALLRKKQRLARLVVHDLRNPLAALQGHLELMREDLSGYRVPPTVSEGLEDCSALVAKALALLTSILDVEELEEGVLRARPVLTEVYALVQRAASVNRPAMRIRQLRVSVDVAPGLTARLDPDLMYRVIESLLDNAVRYAPRAGQVRVWARRDGDAVEIAIGNDGPPVPEDEREAIFGRYYRIEERRAGARAGRGLGLYFCRLAVKAQGGSLTVEQRGGMGAVFVARLPQRGD